MDAGLGRAQPSTARSVSVAAVWRAAILALFGIAVIASAVWIAVAPSPAGGSSAGTWAPMAAR